MFFGEISTIIFLIISSICAVTDTAKRHIDNRVLLAGFIFAAIGFAVKRPHIDCRALLYMLLIISVLFFTFTMRLMGGGDVKLYAFTAFAMPNETGLFITVFSFVLAAAYGIIRLVAGCLVSTDSYSGTGLSQRMRVKQKRGIPMALFVLMATVILLIIRSSGTFY